MQLWVPFRHWILWDMLRRYFQLQVIVPPMPLLAKDNFAIVVQFPHDVFPVGYWLTSVVIGHRCTGVQRCIVSVSIACTGCQYVCVTWRDTPAS